MNPTRFAGAQLLEPIDRRQHIEFIERRIAGQRVVNAPPPPRHIVGDAACREFAEAFPCPQPSYPAEKQDWVDPSLREWAKSTESHSTDQNLSCESRYNRHIFCKGRIPSASQTSATWQTDFPRPPQPFPYKTLSERIQREKKLIREQRENRWLLAQIVSGYENDWRTLAEREDLLRTTKEARRSPYGLPPRSIVKDVDGKVPPDVTSPLKTGKHSKPSEELLSEWNKALYEASKDESTPLRGEIDFYPPSFAENNFDGGEKSSDDERLDGFEFDGINNNGVRETTMGFPNDVSRRDQYQWKYNPLGQSRAAIEQQVRNHPDFFVDAARHEIQMANARIVDVAKQMGVGYDWLRQRLARGNQVLDLYQNNPQAALEHKIFRNCKVPIPEGVSIPVELNNTVEIKHLGSANDSPQQLLDALLRWQKTTTKYALKHERKKARKKGWSDEQLAEVEQAASARIEEADRPFVEWLRSLMEEEGNAVTVSP